MSALSDLSSYAVIEKLKNKDIMGKDLPIPVRQNVVQVLRQECTHAEIAHMISMTERTVDRDVKVLRDNEAKLVDDISIKKVAGTMIANARRVQTAAWKKGNLSLFWRVETELNERLQSMGYIHEKPFEMKEAVEVEAGPQLIKLLGKNNGDGRTFGESWRDCYRELDRVGSHSN